MNLLVTYYKNTLKVDINIYVVFFILVHCLPFVDYDRPNSFCIDRFYAVDMLNKIFYDLMSIV